MANEEQLEILKQGVDVWNKWREDAPDEKIDLIRINLSQAKLSGANFKKADFSYSILNDGIFVKAKLVGADLSSTDLTGADLSDADLGGANLRGASFNHANLRKANFGGAYMSLADFSFADFSDATFGFSILGNNDLSNAVGLDNIEHLAPSEIGIRTLEESKGRIPEEFLRGCGLSDIDIEYAMIHDPELSNQEISDRLYKIHDLRTNQSIQISPLFISYSHADSSFVDKMENHFNDKGIRFWRDVHHATAGRLEKQIDQAIRHNPIVLMILSENSIKSDWVEHETRTARELGKELGRDTLCPVALDDSWKSSHWPKRVMEQVMEYNILDFSEWQDDVKFEGMFRRLIDGLELFYKG